MRGILPQLSKVIWIDKGWQPVYVGFCPDKKAWNTEMKTFKVDDPPEYPKSDGCTYMFTNEKTGDSMVLVTINCDDNRALLEVVGIMAHEATHVFDYICEMIGEEEPSKEFKAYSIQAITMELLDAWDKTRRKGEVFGTKE